jgi:phage protein D
MWPNMQLKERDAVGNAKRSTEQSMASSDSNTKSCSQQESDRATDKQPEVNDDCAEDASSPSPLAESDVAVLCDSTLGDATKEAGGEDSRSREREMASVLASVLKAEADDDTKDEVNSSSADFDLNSWIGKVNSKYS